MKAWFYYAAAGALLAAPLGWIVAGALRAQSDILAVGSRLRYVSGNYVEAALLAATIAFVAILMVGLGKRYTRRHVHKTVSQPSMN